MHSSRSTSRADRCELRPEPFPAGIADDPVSGGPIRVLFGSVGWPCGMFEVASWAKHSGLAQPVVFQIQPGYAFRLDPEDRHFLEPGIIDAKLVASFGRRRHPLSEDSVVVATGPRTKEIRDRRRGQAYRVLDTGDELEVYIPRNCEGDDVLASIRRFAEDRGLGNRFFNSEGAACDAVRDALVAVGGQFVKKLIEFDPHVVGFRLEGGDLEDVRRFVRAVRLFCNAEVVIGGPTATSHPREVLEDLEVDYVFAGEAEEPFAQFLRLAPLPNSKDRQPEIPGLAFRYGGRTYHNTLPSDGYERTVLDGDRHVCGRKLQCLRNAIRPVADAELLAANRLDWSLWQNYSREFDSLFFTGGRGCPGACTFCARLHGQQVRIKSAAQLLEEIEAADAKVADGTVQITRWDLFEHVADPALRGQQVGWAAIYDEDFFLHRRRAIEFLRLWDQSPLRRRYRVGFQTNPCSLLRAEGRFHPELLKWIDRIKPMIQVGAESFNPSLLARWRKRHNVEQLKTVLDALDTTHQDYAIFILLSDFDTTPEELVETLRLLILNALPRRRMRIASSPFTIPLFDSETRRLLECRGFFTPGRIRHFSDYERPRPDWMIPLAADLADLADSELRWTLNLPNRESALVQAMEVVLERIHEEEEAVGRDRNSSEKRRLEIGHLREQTQRAMDQIKDARFQGIEPLGG